MPNQDAALHDLFKLLFQAHPWHDVTPGENARGEVGAYIEIVPTDPVKYELDKASGHLRVDRPQRFSSMCLLRRLRRLKKQEAGAGGRRQECQSLL